MICSQCATPLVALPTEGGENAKVVVTDDKRPMPLRCIGCAKVFCHVCQTTKVDASAGMSAASVSTVCPSCGDRLELVRGAAPLIAPSAPPARREMPPAVKDLFERELARGPSPPPSFGTNGCFPWVCALVGGILGANAFGPHTSNWWAIPGGLAALVAGAVVEWTFVKLWRAVRGGSQNP